jgi:hypothetical protein
MHCGPTFFFGQNIMHIASHSIITAAFAILLAEVSYVVYLLSRAVWPS